MHADGADFYISLPQVAFSFVMLVAFLLALGWFSTRDRRNTFRVGRVIGVTLICLATSTPFWWIAYLLWPWDFQSGLLKGDIFLAVFTPLIVAYIWTIIRGKLLPRKYEYRMRDRH